jgi:chloride channel 3/4/5
MSHTPRDEEANEGTRLLDPRVAELTGRKSSRAQSIISSHISKAEEALGGTSVGERLPYNDYTTIDWLHDLVSALPPS